MYLSVQGKVIHSSEFRIDPLSESLMYGSGIFETINFERDEICFLQDHLERMRSAAQTLRMELCFSDEQIETFLHDLIAAEALAGGVAKINLLSNLKENILMITIRQNPYTAEQYQNGFRLKISEYRRNERSSLVGIKSNNYLENILEYRKAKAENFDEALFLNSKEEIAECCMSNIFFVRSGVLYTPSDNCGILKGIMRSKVLTLSNEIGLAVRAGQYGIDDLMNSDEAFLTNSVFEIMPVAHVNQKTFGRIPGSITAGLRERFDCSVGR